MNHAQKYLAQANRRHIAELTVQIVRQRVIVKHPLDTGQRSEMTESLLDALEGSLRIFEKHLNSSPALLRAGLFFETPMSAAEEPARPLRGQDIRNWKSGER